MTNGLLVSVAPGAAELFTTRDIVDRLANTRRDLVRAKHELVAAEREAIERKVSIVSDLVREKGADGLGKNESDRNRTIDAALAEDRPYATMLVGVRQLKETVDVLAVEVEVFAEYFALSRLEARVALASAISGSGMRVEDV